MQHIGALPRFAAKVLAEQAPISAEVAPLPSIARRPLIGAAGMKPYRLININQP